MREAKWGWGKTQAMFAAIVISSACLGVASIASAGAAPGAESVDDLQSTIEQLKQTVNALEQKMAIMEENQAATDKQVEEVVKNSGDAGGLKLPEDTTMTIYGYAKMDALWTDTQTLGTSESIGNFCYVPSVVPLSGTNLPDNQFKMHTRQTRVGLLTSTPTEYGQFKVRLEGDFYGGNSGNDRVTNSYTLRMRRAYGEMGNLLIGQEWTTFIDLSNLPETLDFGGPAGGVPPQRQAMVRWTQPLDFGSLQFALENPSSKYTTKTENADGTWSDVTVEGNNEYVPDIIVRLNLNPSYGKYSIIGMGRRFAYDDGQYNESTWGGALRLNAELPTFGKDNIHLHFNYGNGLGRYMESGFTEAFINPVTHELETNTQIGGWAGYQHFWTDSLRSSVIYSLAQRDNDLNYVTDAQDKKYQSVHANLVWSPVPRVNVGLEYIWGYREIENGDDGDINRIQSSFIYKF